MLTPENMGPVREAYRQDLRAMERGTYTAPLPASSMYDLSNSFFHWNRVATTRRKNTIRRKESVA